MFNLGRRSQTTKGIWIAKGVGIEPFTVVMDLEGTDGRERGEVVNFSLFVFTRTYYQFMMVFIEYNVDS